MKIGSTDIIDCKIGSTQVNKVYLGSNLVWEKDTSYDADAQAFLTATGIPNDGTIFFAGTPQEITGQNLSNAVNQLVLDLKGYGLWNKMHAIYPFVGGTSFTHKFNLKDPRDLDVAFRIAFNGTFTHSSNGIAGNGSNAFANTFFVPSANLSTTSQHISIYSRTNSAQAVRDCGSYSVSSDAMVMACRWSDSNGYFDIGSNFVANFMTDSLGHYLVRKNTTNQTSILKNGVLINTATSGDTISNRNIYLSALNNNNTATAFSNRQYAFVSIGDGLTDAEVLNSYILVQAFQTTLSRNV